MSLSKPVAGGDLPPTISMEGLSLSSVEGFSNSAHGMKELAVYSASARKEVGMEELVLPNTPIFNGIEQTSGWFKLPAEIRNKIYGYICKDYATYEIKWLSRTNKLAGLTYWKWKTSRKGFNRHKNPGRIATGSKEWNKHFRKKDMVPQKMIRARAERAAKRAEKAGQSKLGKNPVFVLENGADLFQGINGPCAWLRTCKQIHDEGAPFFYSKCAFSFADTFIMADFVNRLLPATAKFIWTIYVSHDTYGDPHSTKFVPWKTIHDLKVMKNFAIVSKKIRELKNLTVLVRLNDTPLVLQVGANWFEPLKLMASKNLRTFKLSLNSEANNTVNNAELRRAAKLLEDAILYKCKLKRSKARS